MEQEQKDWLTANRSENQVKIEEGYAEAQRGELLDPSQVRAQLAARKRALIRDQQS